MNEQESEHAPGSAPDAAEFRRPPGVDAPFAAREPSTNSAPPAPPPSAAEQAVFGRPAPEAAFAPLPGERIPPRHVEVQPVPRALTDAFGAPAHAVGGFAPVPGTRILPAPVEMTMRPHDPRLDAWRDPDAPVWLGNGAVYPTGQPAQLAPEYDTERQDTFPLPEDDDESAGAGVVVPLRMRRRTIALMVLAALAVGAAGGGVGYWLAHGTDSALHRGNVSLAKTGTPANRPPGSVADIAKRVAPAVVSISVTTSTEFGVGSGVVIDKQGDVLTNNHVVASAADGKGTIVVTFSNEATAKARIVGRDPASDLAVLKVPTDQLTVAALGNSDSLAVGDPVIAIGSPLALQGTVTSGIVSALDRPVHISDATTGADSYIDAIQTDAAINHGNSGGALVDASGAVVGINSAAALSTPGSDGQSSAVSGIGFAIPINYARGIATQLIETGKAVHADLGVQGRSATTQDGLQQGAYLEQIVGGGAASKAGLQAGDVVVAAAGRAVLSYDELVVVVQQHKPGDAIAVTYYRGASKRSTTVTLGSA